MTFISLVSYHFEGRRKEIIKTRVEMSEIKNRITIEKMKPKFGSLKISIKLINIYS